ncbi:MAG: hypothetical protein DRR08_03465 [Candidatus Parabeggiatoa sp. nov. 2]|nr:MAG: hypothetical protein DRR08_03465 [Gammaproteobacteria bacterium]
MLLRDRKVERISIWVNSQHHDLPVTEEQCAIEALERFNVAAIMVFERTAKIYFMNTVDLAMKAKH